MLPILLYHSRNSWTSYHDTIEYHSTNFFLSKFCIFIHVERYSLFFFFFLLFRATHAVYEGSQARIWIGAVVASLYYSHSNTRKLGCVCDLHHSSQQSLKLNPVSKARDRTRILLDSRWICYHWATMRTHKCYSTLFNESFGLFPGFFGPFFFCFILFSYCRKHYEYSSHWFEHVR